MNFSSAKYLLKTGVKNTLNNLMMSFASFGVLFMCLFLTGSAILLSSNITSNLKRIESENEIKVFLKEEIQMEEALAIGEQIRKINNILSCEFYSKEQAMESFKDQLEIIYDKLKEENPLPHAYNITLKEISKYSETIAEIKNIPGVDGSSDSLSNRVDMMEKLSRFDKIVSLAGLISIIVLGIISLLIILNTIRLTMYSRRFEISIMKSVGATDLFVRVPFLVEGIVIGLLSSVFSFITLKILSDSLIGYVKHNQKFSEISLVGADVKLLFVFVAAGIVFGIAGGIISIRKYLKKQGGEIIGW